MGGVAICTLWAETRQGKLGEVAMVLVWIAFVVRVRWCSCGGLVGWWAGGLSNFRGYRTAGQSTLDLSNNLDWGPQHLRP